MLCGNERHRASFMCFRRVANRAIADHGPRCFRRQPVRIWMTQAPADLCYQAATCQLISAIRWLQVPVRLGRRQSP
ncbi:MAG: hypothetical protein RLZZ436_3408 [Planctomycetota bacterium]|jgi:hypothetical protein